MRSANRSNRGVSRSVNTLDYDIHTLVLGNAFYDAWTLVMEFSGYFVPDFDIVSADQFDYGKRSTGRARNNHTPGVIYRDHRTSHVNHSLKGHDTCCHETRQDDFCCLGVGLALMKGW
jgi:hypothetical protein